MLLKMASTCPLLTQVGPFPLIAVGDFNLEPAENPLLGDYRAALLAAYEDGVLAPTRWRARRTIDYLAGLDAYGAGFDDQSPFDVQYSWAFALEEVFSDNRPIGFNLHLQEVRAPQRLLQPCRAFACPAEVPIEDWEAQLALEYGYWAEFPHVSSQAEADDAWRCWCERIEGAFDRAAHHFGQRSDPRHLRPKGSSALVISSGQLGATFRPVFRFRRLAKLCGRVRERNRRWNGPVAARLDQTISRSWPGSLPWDADWTHQAHIVEYFLQEIAHQEDLGRLGAWRRKVQCLEGRLRSWRGCPLPRSRIWLGWVTSALIQGGCLLLGARPRRCFCPRTMSVPMIEERFLSRSAFNMGAAFVPRGTEWT